MSILLPGRNMIELSAEAVRAIVEKHLQDNTAGRPDNVRVLAGPYFRTSVLPYRYR